ncbi:MAG: acyl--CoA ligase [Desulfatitalea sp.]|nr:acyl--CoA ligase [Desulfatitalea sp.]
MIHNYLEASANRFPENIAVIAGEHRVSYSKLDTYSDKLANHLQVHGIAKGDRVALLLENSVEYVIGYYAILKAGAAVAPLNPGLKPDGLKNLLYDLEPTAIISGFKSERLLKAVDLIGLNLKLIVLSSPRRRWNDHPFNVFTYEEIIENAHRSPLPVDIYSKSLASIIYTSGSTGKPKGVMLSHGNLVSNTDAICRYLGINHLDIQMVVLPFFYVMGKSLLNTHIAAGAAVVINNRFLYPADVLNQMIEEKVTSFSGVPSTYAYLLNRSPLKGMRDKMPNLRYCSQAGGHMPTTMKRALRNALPKHTKIYVMYGATEAAARLTYLDPTFFEAKIDSIGKPIEDVTIKIMNEKGEVVPTGLEGEIVASGPNIMQGYWKDPQLSRKVLSSYGYHTGDIGYKDSDGFLFVFRRKDNIVKVGGHRVNPLEIEDYLISTELLIEAAVISMPDEILGNKLLALAVPKDGNIDAMYLREKCASGLPREKQPAEIILVHSLPKNESGKIDRERCIKVAAAYQKI